VAKVLKKRLSTGEREFYTQHLLHGGSRDSTDGRQRQLAELLRDTLEAPVFEWSPSMVNHLAKEAGSRGRDWDVLAQHLSSISTCESVLAPASAVFNYLLGLDGKTPQDASRRLQESWGPKLRRAVSNGFEQLAGEVGAGDAPTGARWVGIAQALATRDYDRLVELLLEQSAAVMSQRGGACWIERRAGRFHVRFRDEQGSLPDRNELRGLWRYSYFLDSLRSITRQLGPLEVG
jgi:hypothetical protein